MFKKPTKQEMKEMEEKAADALSMAVIQMVLTPVAECVFFYVLTSNLTRKVDWTMPTAATDGRCIYYNPSFICGLKHNMVTGLIIHEVMHVALMHMTRKDWREHQRWNIACDAAINCEIENMGKSIDSKGNKKDYIGLPEGGVFPGKGTWKHLPLGLSAEEYYPLITDEDVAKCSGAGFGEVIDGANGDPAECEALESQVKVTLGQAAASAQQMGKLPDSISRHLDEVLNPKKDWREILREFVSRSCKNDYNWGVPNRRFIGQGLYLPGMKGEELGDVVVCIDTSGSIGEKELGAFCGELEGILGAFKCKVTMLYHDVRVAHEQVWETEDGPLAGHMEPKGGGGTSHIPVLERAAELSPVICVAMTDMCSTFPKDAPEYPMLWLSTYKDAKAPFGDIAYLHVE